MAFWGTDIGSFVTKLKARGIVHDLRRAPEGGRAGGVWQLFFHDPNGARVEIDFAPDENLTDGGASLPTAHRGN